MKNIKDILTQTQGNITYDEFSYLDFSNGVVPHIHSLKEDLLQLEYPNNILLDLGWYPSFDVNGCFKLKVIMNNDWEHPLWNNEACDIDSLLQAFNEAIIFIGTYH